MYYPLARKYRPQKFSEVIGQEHIIKTLSNAIKQNRIHHAYLFTGPRGIGKTTVARIFAKSLNCVEGPTLEPCNKCAVCVEITKGSSMNIIEIDGASYTGVDEIREIRDNLHHLPTKGKYRMYIIDEVHMLSTSAFNALLKILEEPPPHVIFVFATTEPHKLPPTVVSRCLRFPFTAVPQDTIVKHLLYVAEKENVELTESAARLIAVESEGSVRDALSMLDQIINFTGGKITDEDVIKGLGILPERDVYETIEKILEGDADGALSLLNRVWSTGMEPRKFSTQLVESFRNIVVFKVTQNPSLIKGSEWAVKESIEIAKRHDSEVIISAFSTLAKGLESAVYSIFSRSLMEVAIVKASMVKELINVAETFKVNPPAKNAPQNERTNDIPPFARKLIENYGGKIVNIEKRK